MNTVFNNYSMIPDLELNRRIAYYESSAFLQEVVTLMIPDVCQYVRKIFYSMRLASQCRLIVEDICNQIVEIRKVQKHVVTSIGYRVGTLEVDGRAYAQQNVRWWCQQIAGTIDCLTQILNIVFALGKRPWDTLKPGEILKDLEKGGYIQLVKLCKDYAGLISTYKKLDNFDKHNLTIWGKEKFAPKIREHVDYYLRQGNSEYSVSELISEKREREIKIALVELLDNIFILADANYNQDRKYVCLSIDAQKCYGEIFDQMTIPYDQLVQISITTKTTEIGCVTESASIILNHSPCNEIYLAQIGNVNLPTYQGSSLQNFCIHELVVLREGNCIGSYRCENENDKNADYFHFKKYSFSPS